jgi:hypothetical protein
MAIRIFVTGGTFDKEYNEITGQLFGLRLFSSIDFRGKFLPYFSDRRFYKKPLGLNCRNKLRFIDRLRKSNSKKSGAHFSLCLMSGHSTIERLWSLQGPGGKGI